MSNVIMKSSMIEKSVEEYDRLREEAKQLKKRMDELSKSIKEYAMQMGTQDDKGSYHCEVANFEFGAQARKSVSFNEEVALAFFKGRKLNDAIKMVEKIDEEVVEKYVTEGEVSFEELEQITNVKTTYALSIKAKEEMPTIEEVPVQSVASKKRPLFKKK